MASCGLRRLHRPPRGSPAVAERPAGRIHRLCGTWQRDIRGCLCPCPGPQQAPWSCPPCPEPSPSPAPTVAQQHDETDGSQHGWADQKCHSGAAHSSYGVRTAGDLGVALPATDMWGLSHAGGTGVPQPHCPILSHSPSHLGTATSARRAGTMLGHGRDTWPCSGKGQGASWGTAVQLVGSPPPLMPSVGCWAALLPPQP